MCLVNNTLYQAHGIVESENVKPSPLKGAKKSSELVWPNISPKLFVVKVSYPSEKIFLTVKKGLNNLIILITVRGFIS